MTRIIQLICLLLLSAFSATGATYYVAPSGSDSADGSQGTPWATPYHALPLLLAGDTLNILAGTYTLTNHYLTTGTNGPITVNGPGVIEGSGIYIGHSNWCFNGLVLSNITDSYYIAGAGFVLTSGAQHTVVTNCIFRDSPALAYGLVWVSTPDCIGLGTNVVVDRPACNCLVSNCLFTNLFGMEAVRVGGSNNLVVNNYFSRIMNGDVFQIYGVSNVIRGNFITNVFYRLDIGGGQHADMFQIYGQDGNVLSTNDPYFEAWGNVAEDNQFWDARISFAQMTADVISNTVAPPVRDFTLRNNLFVRCGGQDAYNGGTGGSICSIGVPYVRIVNNTFVDCAHDTNTAGNMLAFSMHTWTAPENGQDVYLGMATNCVVENNAFVNCGLTTNYHIVEVEAMESFGTNNWNLTCRSNYCVIWDGADWLKMTTNWDNNLKGSTEPSTYQLPLDIFGESSPLLVAYDLEWLAKNYRPLLGSPLIDAGVDGAVGNDIEGTLRPMGVRADIGCFEFDPNLIVHLDFNEGPDTSGYITDVSGYDHTAWMFDITNLIYTVDGPQGNQAGVWTVVGLIDGYNLSQYAALTNIDTPLQRITNGTVSAWVKWGTNAERYDVIMDAAGEPPSTAITPLSAINSWTIQYGEPFNMAGSLETNSTPFGPCFIVNGYTPVNDLTHPSLVLHFNQPRDGSNWWHIAVTWTGNGSAIAYQNGHAFLTNSLDAPWLRVNASPTTPWIGVGAGTHGGTPQWGDDAYPNAGFFKGQMADLRIYNRALSPAEVAVLGQGVPLAAGGGSSPENHANVLIGGRAVIGNGILR